MRYAFLTLPMLAGCAAFQTGATPEEVATAEDQITQGVAFAAPFVGPFAPFLPIAAALAIKIGKFLRDRNKE